MGHKIVCIECKKSFSQGTDFNNRREMTCPECKKEMIQVSHRFRPPKKTDIRKWEVVRFLLEHGFLYHHVYQKIDTKDRVISYEDYAKYPEDMPSARELVVKYKDQSINKDK